MSNVSNIELADPQDFPAAEKPRLKVLGHNSCAESRDLPREVAHDGGCIAGAFSNSLFVDICWSFPARAPRAPRSHRLGGLPAWRDQGIGAELKQFHFDWRLKRGIRRTKRTFDLSRPLMQK